MSIPWVIRMNGLHDYELGLRAVVPDGNPWTPAPLERARAGRSGAFGSRPEAVAVGGVRTIPSRVYLDATVGDRWEKLDRILSLSHGVIELEWYDAPGRLWLVRIDRPDVEAAAQPSFVNGGLVINLNFEDSEGVAWAREPTVLSLPANVPVPCPVGTTPSVPVFRWPGAFSDVEVRLLRPSGEPFRDGSNVIRRFVYAGAVGATEYLEADGGTFGSPATILGGTASRVSVGGYAVDGQHDPFVLDPALGDPARERWPMVLSTRAGVLEYVRTYR